MGDRILLAGQTNAVENGIYVVKSAGAPDRSSDLLAGFSASGVYTFVDEGTVYKDRAYICITNRGQDVVGTDSLEFVQFSARASAIAGQGLVTGVGEQLDVNVDNVSLVIVSDTVQVKAQGITNDKIADGTVANAKLVNPSLTVGTGRGLSGGQLINLGASATLTPDFTVVPDLAASNTFTQPNTFQGTVTAPRVTGLQAPTDNTDAVNLSYVTETVNKATQSSAARAVATSNVASADLYAGYTVDGVVLAQGDRLLLTAQTDSRDNGLYDVPATAGGAVRSALLPVGANAAGLTLIVKEGTTYHGRLFLCTNASGNDVVGTHNLLFTHIAQSLEQVAGTSNTALGTLNASLQVLTDATTIQINGATNRLQLTDLGITNAKIADATIANAKLVNPNVTINTNRGLSGGGAPVSLGSSVTISPDFSVVPDLANPNTFTAANTFQGSVTVTSTAASTSQTTGALVVSGGVGIAGDVYANSTYNMSDQTLKDQIVPLAGALDVVDRMGGYSFT